MAQFAAAALLFDMDGTLVDSTGSVERCWDALSERYELDAVAVRAAAHGVRARDTIAKFLPEHLRDEAFHWLEARESSDLDGVVEIAGAAQMLLALNELAAPWAIVTSATPVLAFARLEAAGLPRPRILVTADRIANGKPAPDGYLLAADELGVSARTSIVLEDVPAGIRAGQAAGATVVVRGGYRGPETVGLHTVDDYRAVRFDSALDDAGRILGSWG